MNEYHKIQTVFKRDPATKFKTLLEGEYSLPEFEYLANNEWVFTEKVDGTNIRVIWDADHRVVRYAGKTDKAQIYAPLVDRLRQQFDGRTHDLAEHFPEGVCLYGEGYGARIQKGGGNYRDDVDFVLFDVKVGDWWLLRPDVEDVAQKLGLVEVPIIGTGTLANMVSLVSAGFASQWGDFPAEGIVARPGVELRTRAGHRVITKLKQKDFR